jgi:acetyl esterase/lipase
VAATISYRLMQFDQARKETTTATPIFPAQIHDAKAAIRWVRAHAKQYQVDPDRIGVTGASAGGHLSLLVGLTDPSSGLEGDSGNPDQSSRVQAVVNVFGPTDMVAGGSRRTANTIGSPGVAPFAGVRYVRGQDLVIRQPLPQIAPLEPTIGVRLEDIEASKPWGLEGGLRMVARQTRFASVRAMYTEGNVVPVELATPGFSTAYLRGFYRPRQNLNIIGGVENLFDRTYIEHLDLRLPAGQGFGETRVLSPGITPFVAVEWTL